ncbi:MAG TPA: hypothetical protein VFE60_11715 [Roseiarcus sp.]|nr:hypothetical protein [Roseiarcus sp.]
MLRKLTDTVQINLRIKEAERRRLEAAAKDNGVSINAEMAARLARTFRQTAMLEIDQLAENVSRFLKPLLADAHELAKSGDLIRAADDMAALLASSSSDQDAITAAIDRYGKVKRMIEIEAGIRVRQMHTTGAQP